jgi:hypothetical protein
MKIARTIRDSTIKAPITPPTMAATFDDDDDDAAPTIGEDVTLTLKGVSAKVKSEAPGESYDGDVNDVEGGGVLSKELDAVGLQRMSKIVPWTGQYLR